MAKQVKVIVDTNIIYNNQIDTFLGGREELEKFSERATILIPEMVIDEIKSGKRRELLSERDKFLSNRFHSLMEMDEEETKNFNIEKLISELQDEEDIQYTTILLKDSKVIEEMKVLALNNDAPFHKGSDKGFKDAYIYFTVLEYLQQPTNTDEIIFFLTRDSRLKEAFKTEGQIRAIGSFDEFEQYDPTNLEKLGEEIEVSISREDIKDTWLNREKNWIVEIRTDGKTVRVEVDSESGEAMDHACTDAIEAKIQNLINSDLFSATHTAIEKLEGYGKYFSHGQMRDLIEAAIENSQISRIAYDNDVKKFFSEIYEQLQELEQEIRDRFEEDFLNYRGPRYTRPSF